MSRVTALTTQADFALVASRCSASRRVDRLHYEDTVLSDGIPAHTIPDHFVMNAELAALRRQEGRNSTALTVRVVSALNGAARSTSTFC